TSRVLGGIADQQGRHAGAAAGGREQRKTLVIPFNDLKPLRRALAEPVDAAVRRALESGWDILRPEGEAVATAFAPYHGRGIAVGVANGTEAIELALRAAGIGPGDEVITVAHTAVATVCAVERAGARPVLVDIHPASYTMDPAAARAAITSRTRALLPVHLYGQPADMGALVGLAERAGLLLIEDCGQAHGARYKGRRGGRRGPLPGVRVSPAPQLAGTR